MAKPKEVDGIKSNLIVHEVQKRPCLYDSNHPHYGDRSEKARCWEEVCECIVPGWAVLSLADKLGTGKDIQKRWRSIRDSYTKAYRQGKCVPLESCPPNSKRYHYHSQMSFLLKALQNKKPRYSLDRNDSDLSNSPQPLEELMLPKLADAGFSLKQMDIKTKQEFYDPEKDNIDIKTPSLEIKFDANSILPSDYFDDDKLFMNSLLPLFKKMDDDTRLMCRIEVLKIIRFALQGKKDIVNEINLNSNMGLNKESTASTLSMTTRSADGSRTSTKRRTHSPSPVQGPPKKRGPGRPRKIRPPSSDEEENKKVTPNKNKIRPNPIQPNKIHRNPIQPNKIHSNSIQPNKIHSNSIQPNKIHSNSIQPKKSHSNKIQPNTIEKNMPLLEPRLSELEEKLNTVSSVAQLETPLFMKMYNLERAKVTSTSNQVGLLPVKKEPVESDSIPLM